MKSIYEDPTFSEYWNERAGDSGEVYKRLVLDPAMFKTVGTLKQKTILELGCGNGYLVSRFLEEDPASVMLVDISKHNLEFAKQKTVDSRVTFLEQDATEPWRVQTGSIDLVYSNMMLNEVENIRTPIEESFRVLKQGGVFIFSITHPGWDLFVFAQEKAGLSSKKIKGLGNYFRRGYSQFIMGSDSKTNPALAEKFKEEFEVEHYQRPISDYFNQLVSAGFTVKQLIEPELNEAILSESPRFAEYKDHPIALIFLAIKS